MKGSEVKENKLDQILKLTKMDNNTPKDDSIKFKQLKT